MLLAQAAQVDSSAPLRGWIALALATVVGSATVVGVVIAVRTYVASAWDRKVAAARLVWAVGVDQIRLKRGAQVPTRAQVGAEVHMVAAIMLSHEDGDAEPTVLQDSVGLLARIHNNSDEPIGPIEVTAEYHGGPQQPHSADIHDLAPGQSVTSFFLLPAVRSRVAGVDFWAWYSPVIQFNDSAGTRWRRAGTSPPTVVHKPRSRTARRRDEAASDPLPTYVVDKRPFDRDEL